MSDNGLPKHVAFIVDGNRRWARRAQLPFFDAYKIAGENLVDIVVAASRMGVRNITAFLFSTENWKRDKADIEAVMTAFKEILFEHTGTFKANGIRAHTIGHTAGVPDDVQQAIAYAIQETSGCCIANFVLAFNYGGRWDIVSAIKAAASRQNGDDWDGFNEQTLSRFISTATFGDPELLIRTGGQQRVSNFLLWQLAYAELYFSELMWPDFTAKELELALRDYADRERRLGGG